MLKMKYVLLEREIFSLEKGIKLTASVATNNIIFSEYCAVTVFTGRPILTKPFSFFGSLTTYRTDATFPSSPTRKTLNYIFQKHTNHVRNF